MSEIIDFVIKFKETGLSGITNNSNSLLGSLNKTLAMTQVRGKYATESIAGMNKHLDDLRKRRDISIDTRQIATANKEISALEHKINRLSSGHNTSSGGGGGLGGGLLGGLLKGGGIIGAVMAAGYAAKSIAVDGISAAMAYGTRVKSFEVLTGNATKGRDLASSLREMKMNSLVGGGVYQNAQTLLGFGVNENTILKKIREVGDVGMGDTDKMASLTLARAQTSAAGKLMGQDLLQYVNAGFNPLNVMSERWKDFGFKAKKTIGELKDMMSEGEITSGMVDKSFTLATGKGGRFYNMMDQIGQTAGGKFLRLKGAWAASQIDIGNALMPIATSAMEAGSGLLHFMNISKTVPETLRGERSEITTLIDSISHLNQGNIIRGKLIDTLKGKYGDIFGSIDTEKVKNEDLLKMLDKVNSSYERRIQLSSYELALNHKKDKFNDIFDYASKAKAYGSGGDIDNWDRIKMTFSGQMGFKDYFKYFNDDAGFYAHYAKNAENSLPGLQKDLSRAETNAKGAQVENLLKEVQDLRNNPKGLKDLWGKSYNKNLVSWNSEIAKLEGLRSGGVDNVRNGSFLNYDYTKLNALVHPDRAENPLAGMASDTGNKITGGGNRQIIINMNSPMVGGITNHVQSMSEANEMDYRTFQEMFLRVIQTAKQTL